MKIVWLGQGGLLIVSGKKRILVDPYLSNSCKKRDKNMARRVRVKRSFLRSRPDMIILTNSHPDHTDITTLSKLLYRSRKHITVLACENSYRVLESAGIKQRFTRVMFGEGDEWTFENILIRGLRAKTDDKTAFGFVLDDSRSEKRLYYSGNTLYSRYVIEQIPTNIDVAFIPISGEYGCMNIYDAARFAIETKARSVVPISFGMFDNVNPKKLVCSSVVIPKHYKPIPFEEDENEEIVIDGKEINKKKKFSLKALFKEEHEKEKAYIERRKLILNAESISAVEDPVEEVIRYEDESTREFNVRLARAIEAGRTYTRQKALREEMDKYKPEEKSQIALIDDE